MLLDATNLVILTVVDRLGVVYHDCVMTRNTIMTELLNRTSPMDAGPLDDTARYLEGEDTQ